MSTTSITEIIADFWPTGATGVRWANDWTECQLVVEANLNDYEADARDEPGVLIYDQPGVCDMHAELAREASDGDEIQCPMAS
jgi:hypothetical protein